MGRNFLDFIKKMIDSTVEKCNNLFQVDYSFIEYNVKVMIGSKGVQTATESRCLLRIGAELLLSKSPMNSSPKITGFVLFGLGRGATWALTRSRLFDR